MFLCADGLSRNPVYPPKEAVVSTPLQDSLNSVPFGTAGFGGEVWAYDAARKLLFSNGTEFNHHHHSATATANDDDDISDPEALALGSHFGKLLKLPKGELLPSCDRYAGQHPSWHGRHGFFRSLNRGRLACLLSWLYVYNLQAPWDGAWHGASLEPRHLTQPFAGVANPVGKMVAQVRAHNPAPLSPSWWRKLLATVLNPQPDDIRQLDRFTTFDEEGEPYDK